jgi:hypothetical protein
LLLRLPTVCSPLIIASLPWLFFYNRMASAGPHGLGGLPPDHPERLSALLDSFVARQLISEATKPALLRELAAAGLQPGSGAGLRGGGGGVGTRELTVHLLRSRTGFGFAVADVETFPLDVQQWLGPGVFVSFVDPVSPAGADGSLAVYDQIYRVSGQLLTASTAAEVMMLIKMCGS